MIILIANVNKDFFTSFDKKIKFVQSTKNTSTFKISTVKFEKLRTYIREMGLNSFALMAW